MCLSELPYFWPPYIEHCNQEANVVFLRGQSKQRFHSWPISMHFWDQMDTVTEEQLLQVQSTITQTLFQQGWVSSKLLFYDLTNFFTFIDTANTSSTLAQRGHNKQKRHDLRQFGLAQATTKEYLLPILSEVYEGNRNDRAFFLPFLEKVKALFQSMEQPLEEPICKNWKKVIFRM